MKLRDFSVTPNKITELSCCEVFVFGSNLKAIMVVAQHVWPWKNLAQNGVLALVLQVNVMQSPLCKVMWKLLNLT